MKQSKSHNKICGRICVELTGSLASPLSIGSGEQEDSDGDVILNAQGIPYIPGSSLAGALRSYTREMRGQTLTNKIFGTPYDGTLGAADDRQSRIFFYDTLLEPAKIRVRDGVKLNENKKAVSQAKYDQQIVERGARFKMRIEVIQREDCLQLHKDIQDVWKEEQQFFQMWMHGFSGGELRIGAKSQRGFGRIEIQQAKFKKFDMTNKESYVKWLDWDWAQTNAFEGLEEENIWTALPESEKLEKLEHTLEIPLSIQGTLLIRTYGAAFNTVNLADYAQLVTGEKTKQAIIPGSSWAGAFRSHIAKIIQELSSGTDWEMAQKRLEPFFGTWVSTNEKKQKLRASQLVFEETVIQGGNPLPISRIAVDRFTGGTVEGALYESLPWSGGKFRLCIRWKKTKDREMDQVICGMLLWAVADLQSGILPIGGETAVGRGICEPDQGQSTVLKDGDHMQEKEKNECMRAAARWVRGEEKNGITGTAGDSQI